MTDPRRQARELESLLGEFAAELDKARDPDQIAMRSLGLTKAGATERAYSDEAFRIWGQQYERTPDDHEALHHLAIMHHARAIDREQSADPTVADDDWVTAMTLWYALWQSDAFWESTTAALKTKNDKGDPVGELRSEFPALYLQIHYDIAADDGTKPHRIKHHVKAVLDSPFSDEATNQVRHATYARYVAKIPETIWSNATPEIEQAKQASDVILSYLRIDPEYREALGDALRILDRLLQTRVSDINAIGQDQAERIPIFTELRAFAETWLPYLQPLADDVESLTLDVRRDLCHWAYLNGQIHQGLGRDNDAIKFFGLGERVGSPGDGQRLRSARDRLTTEAKVACDKAVNKASGAKSYAKKIAEREDLTPLACFLLAQTFQALDDFDRAEAVCGICERVEPEASDHDFAEEDEHYKRETRELRESITVARGHKEIQAALEKRDYGSALKLANALLMQQPNDNVGLFLRIQANMGVNNLDDATADLASFRTTEIGRTAEVKVTADELEAQITMLKARRDVGSH